MTTKPAFLLLVAAFFTILSLGLRAEEESPYVHEIAEFKFFETAKWKSLTPLISTMADVRKTLGDPVDPRDLAHYADKYPGDQTAEEPVFDYVLNAEWELLIYFVKTNYGAKNRFQKSLHDCVYSIDLVPIKNLSFKDRVFPDVFKKRKLQLVDEAWDVFEDGSGLSYNIYHFKSLYGHHEPGDLARISYGPSNEAMKKAEVTKP